jgi:hypothetical protein
MDLPDLATKDVSEEQRSKASGSPAPAQPPGDNTAYSHLYYPQSFFNDFAREHTFKVKIFSQKLKGYGNAPFRFNALFRR